MGFDCEKGSPGFSADAVPMETLRWLLLFLCNDAWAVARLTDDDVRRKAAAVDWRRVDWVDVAEWCEEDDHLAGLMAMCVDGIRKSDWKGSRRAYGLCLASMMNPGFVRSRAVLLELFLASGFKVDDHSLGMNEGSLLGLAASFSRPDLVEACLALSPNPDAGRRGCTPLLELVANAWSHSEEGDQDAVRSASAMLRSGASPFCEDGKPVWTLLNDRSPAGLLGLLRAAAERESIDGPEVGIGGCRVGSAKGGGRKACRI